MGKTKHSLLMVVAIDTEHQQLAWIIQPSIRTSPVPPSKAIHPATKDGLEHVKSELVDQIQAWVEAISRRY